MSKFLIWRKNGHFPHCAQMGPGRGGRGGVSKPRRGPGWGGRGEVSKPRGGHHEKAEDQVTKRPRGGPRCASTDMLA
jgi:hypothetical protein